MKHLNVAHVAQDLEGPNEVRLASIGVSREQQRTAQKVTQEPAQTTPLLRSVTLTGHSIPAHFQNQVQST